MIKNSPHTKFFTSSLYLLEMCPSFPYQKRERRLAWFLDLEDYCCCGSIRRDCQSETFSTFRGWQKKK